MNRSHILRKLQLGIDLSLCSLCLLFTFHHCRDIYVLNFLWLLRLWTSFLLYRRSVMAAYSIGLTAIVGLLVVFFPSDVTALILDMIKVIVSIFGGDGRSLVHRILEGAEGQQYVEDVYSSIGIVTYIWLVVYPLGQLIYLSVKKRLRPSSWSLRRSLGLCFYLIILMSLVVFCDYKVIWSALFIVIGLYALPYLFRGVDYEHLLSRTERTCLSLMSVLVASYAFGYDITVQAVLAVLVLPPVCYAVFNYSCSQKPQRREIALMILAGLVFWTAQFTTNMSRILLLLLSLSLFGVVVVTFVNTTRSRWKGLILFVFAAIIIPVVSLGYNPYTVLHASRVGDFEEYFWGRDGLLSVESADGYGIRDRYGIVLPARCYAIEVLDYTKPYLAVRGYEHHNGEPWQLFDIERQDLVIEDYFKDIRVCDDHTFLLEGDTCFKYMKYHWYYDKFSEDSLFIIADSMSDTVSSTPHHAAL